MQDSCKMGLRFTDYLPPAAQKKFKAWCSKGGKGASKHDKVKAGKLGAQKRWAGHNKQPHEQAKAIPG